MGRMYRGGALSRPVSESVALVAGALAFVTLFLVYLWAASLGLPVNP